RVGLDRPHPRQRYAAVVYQALDLRARVPANLAREHAIEAQPVVLWVDRQLDLRHVRWRDGRATETRRHRENKIFSVSLCLRGLSGLFLTRSAAFSAA